MINVRVFRCSLKLRNLERRKAELQAYVGQSPNEQSRTVVHPNLKQLQRACFYSKPLYDVACRRNQRYTIRVSRHTYDEDYVFLILSYKEKKTSCLVFRRCILTVISAKSCCALKLQDFVGVLPIWASRALRARHMSQKVTT